MLHAVVMAGGIGARFWPMSRRDHPKQVVDLLGGGPMLQQTIDRIADIVPPEQRWIVTNQQQADLYTNLIPGLKNIRFVIEPMGRNTAPAIGLAAVKLLREDPEAVMIVLPADHRIGDHYAYRHCLMSAADVVKESGTLATLGIEPTRPETGYGYIQIDHSCPPVGENTFKVKTFAEKPNLQTAKLFLETGEFVWNSGMFIWRADSILREIQESLPDWYAGLEEIASVLGTDKEQAVTEHVFNTNKAISIDYGVMEHAQDVVVVRGSFGWSDVGSWDEVWRVRDHDEHGNAAEGHTVLVGSKNNLVLSRDKLIALIGAENLAVVDTEDVLLVCPLSQAQHVRDVIDVLKERDLKQYL